MLGHITPTPPVRQDARTPDWAVPGIQEFIPGKLDPSALVSGQPHFELCSLISS